MTQIRELRSGSTYISQNALELHFGVGWATQVSFEVIWPGGEVTRHLDLPVDAAYEVRHTGERGQTVVTLLPNQL
jgi:hypothetical protein